MEDKRASEEVCNTPEKCSGDQIDRTQALQCKHFVEAVKIKIMK